MAVTYPIIWVNGVSLVDPSFRWGVAPGQQLFRTLPGIRTTSVQVPGRSGVLWPATDPYDVTRFTVTIAVFGDGADPDARYGHLVQNMESLYFLLSQTPVEVKMQTDSGDNSVRVAKCRVVTTSEPNIINGEYAEITVVFEIPDVFWRSDTLITQATASTITTSAATYDPDVFTGSTAPITDAELLIKGPFTKIRVYNPTSTGTQNGFLASLTASSSQYLYVNAGTLQASLNSSAVWDTSGTDVSSSVDGFGTDPRPGWLTLTPYVPSGSFSDGSDRKVQFSAYATTAGSPTIRIRGKKAYL